MKIGLISALMSDNNIFLQINRIENYLKACANLDLLVFGESYLQGFEGLTWNYEVDQKRALAIESNEISQLKELAQKYTCGLSFGFIENYQGTLYSSNLVIDKQGEIADLFRRVSPGWKELSADEHYQEGNCFHAFKLNDVIFSTAICGDLWYDDLLNKINQLSFDVLLWPLYVDYQVECWENSEKLEYAQRTKLIKVPVLFVNSFVEDNNRAKGGCYLFDKGEVKQELAMGAEGCLRVEIS